MNKLERSDMTRFNSRLFSHSIVVSLSALLACRASAADLIVIVDHLKSRIGNVRAAVFDDPKAFPKAMLQGQKSQVGDSAVTLTFKDLPKGRYAVSAYQDLNLNDKLDTNAFGMPKEPYGFSQKARGRFGPPSFEEASFEFGNEDKTIHIQVE